MNTINIRGAKCIPCPIDGKNLNDCWEELFQDFTSNVIGGYHGHRGSFAFCMDSADASMFTFEHFRDSHEITFTFHNGIHCTSADIFRLKREMEQICSYCHEANGVYHHVLFCEWRGKHEELEKLDVDFYVEIDD